MFYKEDMELKLLQFEMEQNNTEIYILKKNRQLYKDALFWNELANLYIEAGDYEEVNKLLKIQKVFIY